MMEQKLRRAAEQMPEPKTTFLEVGRKACQTQPSPAPLGTRRLAIAALCVILLLATACAAVTGLGYTGMVSYLVTRSGVERALDISLPSDLDDSPCIAVSCVNVVPKDTNELLGRLFPDYRWYGLEYGVNEIVRETYSDEAGSGFAEWTETRDSWSLTVGGLDDELWQHCFSMNADGTLAPDNQMTLLRTEQYRGIDLLIGIWPIEDWENPGQISSYLHKIIWVDWEAGAIFDFNTYRPTEEFPEELLEFAKSIIDDNHPQ